MIICAKNGLNKGSRHSMSCLALHQWVLNLIPSPGTYVHLISSPNMLLHFFSRHSGFPPASKTALKRSKIWSEDPHGKQWYTLSEATLSKYGPFIIFIYFKHYILHWYQRVTEWAMGENLCVNIIPRAKEICQNTRTTTRRSHWCQRQLETVQRIDSYVKDILWWRSIVLFLPTGKVMTSCNNNWFTLLSIHQCFIGFVLWLVPSWFESGKA